MKKRRYYSIRTGKNPKGDKIDLESLKELFNSLYGQLEKEGYFQEHFGYWCVDSGYVPGKLGPDIPATLLFHLRKKDLWPIGECIENYSEHDLFDIIEFLYDHISKPIDGYYHSYSDCGYHYDTFDTNTGLEEYCQKLNEILESYQSGYEISSDGEILELAQPGTAALFEAALPTSDKNIIHRRNAAITKFRRYRSTLDERRDSIRDLADVLEYLRPKIKKILSKKDENDLFNIVNNFGIRHHNQKQKTDYDQAIWLSWMFYYYLATIHACLRMINKEEKS